MANENTETPPMSSAIDDALKALGGDADASITAQDPPEGGDANPQDPPEGGDQQDPPEGGEGGDDQQDPPEGEGDDVDTETVQPEDAVAPDGYARDPETGKFIKKSEAEKAKQTLEQKTPDHINDPIDPKLHERTRERVQHLVNEVKTLQPKAAQLDELLGHIADAGMNSQEYAAALMYGKLSHSSDINDLRRARNFIMNELKGLNEALGESMPGEDVLAGHQDLAAEVAAGKLTQQRAEEIALARNRQAAESRHSESTRATQNAQQQFATEVRTAKTQLDALAVELKAADPDYERKFAIVVPALKAALAVAPPKTWVGIVRKAFTDLKLPKAAPAVTAPMQRKPLGQQPLRTNKQPAGGGASKQPASLMEAMNAGIDAASRR